MSYQVAREVITKFFKDRFVKPDTTDWFPNALEWPNRPISDGTKDETPAWGRFSIRHGMAIGRDVGGGVKRIPGEATLQIFLHEDTGTKLAQQIADQVIGFMENIHLAMPGTDQNIIRFRQVSVTEDGRDGAWERWTVIMPFDRDETKSTPQPIIPVAYPP